MEQPLVCSHGGSPAPATELPTLGHVQPIKKTPAFPAAATVKKTSKTIKTKQNQTNNKNPLSN